MLVCNVSLRPPRTGIAADLIEVGAALDVLGTGNIVFATLVDDPASVGETVDAYLGEIMVEAASVSESFDAGLVYAASVDEAAIAVAAEDAAVPGIYAATVAESATAADVPDASIGAAAPITTTGTIAVGPLFVFDPTFPSASLTVINTGQY